MPSCSTKPSSTCGVGRYSHEEILECLMESAVALMVYKNRTEKRLASKIGFVAKPISELYYERMAQMRGPECSMKWPVFIQPLSLHEEHCLASHPLWASTQTTNRLHLAWETKMIRRKAVPSISSIETSYQEEYSTLPDINTTSSPSNSILSSYPHDLVSSHSLSQSSSKTPIGALPKL